MKIRVFGASKCENCKKLANGLDAFKISYAFVDAFSPETQKFCDKHHVNRLPHVQVVDEKDKVIFEHVGSVDSKTMQKILGLSTQ